MWYTIGLGIIYKSDFPEHTFIAHVTWYQGGQKRICSTLQLWIKSLIVTSTKLLRLFGRFRVVVDAFDDVRVAVVVVRR